MTMQLMTLFTGEDKRDVLVSDLIWKEHEFKGTILKEIVAITFYVTEPGKLLSQTPSFALVTKGPNKVRFICNDLDEYKKESLNAPSGITTRITIMRDIPEIIVMDEEIEGEKTESKISKGYPVVLMDAGDSFEKKEAVYHMIRNGITTPMVQNMTNPAVLAGHLHQEKEVAEAALKRIQTKDTSIKLPSGVFSRTKYLLKVYEVWVETIFGEMVNHGYVKKLNTLVTSSPVNAYEIIIDEEKIEPLISELLREKKIFFTEETNMDEIDGFNEHMGFFSGMMGSMIQSMAKPIHKHGEIRPEVLDLAKQLKRTPFDAQLNVIEACLKSLQYQKRAVLISEPGTGKTLMMMSTHWMLAKLEERAMKLLILSPDHLVEDVWEEEIKKTLPNVEVHHVTSVSDLRKYDRKNYLDDNVDRAFILAQKHSREAYEYKPTVLWGYAKYTRYSGEKMIDKRNKAFSCPCCGEEVERRIKKTDEKTKEEYYVIEPVKFNFFSSRRFNNDKCKKCNTVLWEPINKETEHKSGFLYSKELKGFYPRDVTPVREFIEELVRDQNTAKAHGESRKATNLNKAIENYRTLELTILGKNPEGKKRSVKRAAVADYIFKKMKFRFSSLIIDELHECTTRCYMKSIAA